MKNVNSSDLSRAGLMSHTQTDSQIDRQTSFRMKNRRSVAPCKKLIGHQNQIYQILQCRQCEVVRLWDTARDGSWVRRKYNSLTRMPS
jgi:hypothetical protein